jgi:hypothetical protein
MLTSKERKFFDSLVRPSMFRSLELVLVTAYPALLFFYLFTSLYFSAAGQDLELAYSETTYGKVLLSVAIYAIYGYIYVASIYICSCDPVVGDDPTAHQDLVNPWNKSTPIRDLLTISHPYFALQGLLRYSTPAATFVVLWQISGWSAFLFVPFWLLTISVGLELYKAKLSDRLIYYPTICLALLLCVGYRPNLFGDLLGSIGVVVLCCICWVGLLGSIVIRLRSRGSLFYAVIIVIAILGYVFSRSEWASRLLPSQPKLAISSRTQSNLVDLGDAIRSGTRYHVFVAAAGGGLRATIWTEAVLRTLEHELHGFSHSIVAISAVSGGSLGAAHFLAENADRNLQPRDCNGKSTVRNYCIDRFMESDFLAAPIASSLSTDLPSLIFGRNSFTNFFGAFPRRDDALVAGWSRRWKDIRGTNHFAEPFMNLWKDRNPGLIVNATSQIFGDRVLVSNLDLSKVYTRERDRPSNLAVYEMPLGTAISLGARFPILSESARFQVRPDSADEIVDGGYIDNFGASTLGELIDYLVKTYDLKGENIVVVQITNDQSTGVQLSRMDAEHAGTEGCAESKPITQYLELPAFLQPLGTMDTVRTAGGLSGAALLQRSTKQKGGIYVHFGLLDFDAPLSWTLSKHANDEIWARLESPCNKAALDRLKQAWLDLPLSAAPD